MDSLADRARYTVGWIAPMALELVPAIAILERHGTLQVAGDDALYHVGQIGGHCVAMVVCPRIGTHPAATVVANMRRSFQNIKHILVVGIAGGVPNYGAGLQEQIVLGDVVIGVPQYNEGGVSHYEFGAWEGEGRLTRSGHTLHPSSALLTAVNYLRAFRMQKRGTLIPQFLRDLRQRLDEDELLEFKDPGLEHDHLFDDDYPHPDSKKLCSGLCDVSRSKRREDRGIKAMRKEDQPFIHYGTIGSANTLVISSAKRSELYEEYGLIAFEMESAGVLSDSQGSVVRGICDYADSHKNKTWQKYAAATAVACAKEILLLTPAEAIAISAECSPSEKLEPTVNDGAPAELVLQLVDLPNIQGIRKAMKSCIKLLGLEVDTDFLLETRDATSEKMMHDKQKAISRIKDIYRGATERCRRSLAFKDMMVREEIIAQPEHDTCQWIYLESQYKQWISNSKPLLWIKGNPGSGKSILMKSLFKQRQQLSEESSTILLRFFFNGRGSDMERSQEALYRTLLHGLISSNPLLSCEVLVLYLEKETRGNSFRWQTTELADIFHQKLQRFQSSDIEILIDALDECSDQEVFDVVRRFERTIQNRSNRKDLRGIELVVNENNNGDIREYIQNIFPMGSHESLRSVGREIISRANGTFLWASLVANKLAKAFDEGKDADQLKAILHVIPDGLDDLFMAIFDDASFTTEQREDLQRFAPFVLGVSRPLSVEELYAALLLEGPGHNWSFSDLTLRPDNIQQFKKRLTHASGGLIEVAAIKGPLGLQDSPEGDPLTCTDRTNKRIRRSFLQCGGRDGSDVPDWKITTT